MTAATGKCFPLIVFISLSLCGCTSDSPEGRLQGYQDRLFRTLGVEAAEPQRASYSRFPPRRELREEESGDSIDLLDLWAMRDCELHGAIAQKNSSLGRVAQPSTRMFYELDFLRLAPDCIETLQNQGKNALAETLATVRAAKQQQLPRVLWQGLLGGGEYRQYWKLPQRLGDFSTGHSDETDLALQSLASAVKRWLGSDYRVDPAAVESMLHTIRGGDAGATLKSAMLQNHYLTTIDSALERRLARGPVCGSGTDKKAPILDTVVRKFFVGDIQPWSVRIQARAYRLAPARQIEALLADAEPPAFKTWRLRRDRLLAHALAAPRRHVETLLPLMRQCGLAPDETRPGGDLEVSRVSSAAIGVPAPLYGSLLPLRIGQLPQRT